MAGSTSKKIFFLKSQTFSIDDFAFLQLISASCLVTDIVGLLLLLLLLQ